MSVRDRENVATCLGYGPCYLHSTGQAYKGGPNTGVFPQVAAQARGDFQVLADRKRRALQSGIAKAWV
jgi:transaldolase/glucose-6-phosphate isomerase